MSSRRSYGFLAGLGLLALVELYSAVLRGQVAVAPRPKSAPFDEKKPQANLRVDTNLVLVPVSVCDPSNHPVTGLEKEHFKVFEDKVEQTVTHFAMDDESVAVGLVLDISGSMGPKLRRSRQAAAAFFQTANTDDEFFLVEFNDQPKLVVPLTRNVEEIQNQLTFTQSKGRTALLDAIMLSLHEIKKSPKNRKALLVISDGGDNSSRYTESEVRNAVRESDVLIYAIGVFEPFGSRGRTPEESAGPGLLSEIAEQTGGRHFPSDTGELPDIAAKIGIELRNRYVLGYSPTSGQRDGRYHRLQVKVIPPRGLPPLKAFWRLGYYAPAE
ncbi:MAG TPA: VWA domain-containing protein [Bryobacteraceae bacterium]|nr:von Willebrand factor, type A [Candidatus Sulfopaludibacter sp. SbA4]HYW48106.1 VWA domain-containing protein [Bryobacteraceae bacterium]